MEGYIKYKRRERKRRKKIENKRRRRKARGERCKKKKERETQKKEISNVFHMRFFTSCLQTVRRGKIIHSGFQEFLKSYYKNKLEIS
jgi:hypothetical protein